MTSIDLNEAVDALYRGEQLDTETLQILVPTLRSLERGSSPQAVAEDLNIGVQQAEELAIRRKGWEWSLKNKSNGK